MHAALAELTLNDFQPYFSSRAKKTVRVNERSASSEPIVGARGTSGKDGQRKREETRA
jgi:hypothetical protein